MKTSIARKVLMALSGLFLLLFLFQHFIINMLSFLNEDGFNSISHFMGSNPIIQFVIQPILVVGVVFHLFMGIYLEMENGNARKVKYAMNKPASNSSWMSRNMVITGVTIMLFLGLHFYDFFFPEIKLKYVDGLGAEDPTRYIHEMRHKFLDFWRVAIYCISFVFLALHLLHGFQSAFQSVGFRHNKYTPIIKKLGNIYAIVIPLGFIFLAIYHYVSQLK